MLHARKDALLAKHVEGRESLHELDHIFEDHRARRARESGLDAFGFPSRREDPADNFLDFHRKRMEQKEREEKEEGGYDDIIKDLESSIR